MPVRNIAHDNARKAFKKIAAVKQCDVKIQKEYLSLVRGADTFIHQCGLLQTFAFYLDKAKKKEHHCLLLRHLLEHLKCLQTEDDDRIIDGYSALLNEDDGVLMLNTVKTRNYIIWLKRYAEAMLAKDDDKRDGADENSNQPETA